MICKSQQKSKIQQYTAKCHLSAPEECSTADMVWQRGVLEKKHAEINIQREEKCAQIYEKWEQLNLHEVKVKRSRCVVSGAG
jgi:hypothetical protein